MLGTILHGLTDPRVAEEALTSLGDAAMLERVRHAADAAAVSPGTFVASSVRHLIDHGGDEIWLDLIGKMANAPQPGVVALRVILSRAFPGR